MFWTIYQRGEKHKDKKHTWSHPIYGYHEWWEYKQSFTDDPKRGLGQIVVIEADTADAAWNYGLKIGMNRSSGKWSRPRDRHHVNDLSVAGFKIHNEIIYDYPVIYLHFINGFFCKVNGLHRYILRDLYKVTREP